MLVIAGQHKLEVKMTDEIKKNKDIKEDEERKPKRAAEERKLL